MKIQRCYAIIWVSRKTNGRGIWQQMNLSSAILIQENLEYTVSVNTGNAYYVDAISGFANQIVNGNIKSSVGNNGVLGPVGRKPSESWNNSNYFRDILFVPN